MTSSCQARGSWRNSIPLPPGPISTTIKLHKPDEEDLSCHCSLCPPSRSRHVSYGPRHVTQAPQHVSHVPFHFQQISHAGH